MATSAKLVTDLSVVLRGVRSHEGVITTHLAQAANREVSTRLQNWRTRERAVADRAARAVQGLGAPAPRTRPSWLPSPTSLVAGAATQTQPLGEALVVEATVVRMLADRSRVVQGLAVAVDQRAVADAAAEIIDLYDGYADWLVTTATALVVDEDAADLVPTTTQRLAGRVKDAVGVPARLSSALADRTAATVADAGGRVRGLVGLGSAKVDHAAEAASDTVAGATSAVRSALAPVDASDLPVTRYDDRTAADAVRALRRLESVDDVSVVVAYEARHKDRKTVLDAGEKRVVELSATTA